jgi:CDP-diacylglycerol--glycerol-3-phosphate 3-phosphatidyltransferase
MSDKANSYIRLLALAKKEWKNVPNVLTFSRGPMSIALFFMLIGHSDWAAWLYIAVALTDLVDGWYARRFHQQTLLGKTMDPIMDKLLVAAVGIGLCIARWPDPWVLTPVVIILTREVGVMILVERFRRKNLMLSVTWAGKMKTMAQGIAFFFLIRHPAGEWGQTARYILVVAVTLTVFSGIDYIVRARALLRPIPERDVVD